MKKIITLILIGSFILTMTGCTICLKSGNKNLDQETNQNEYELNNVDTVN